MHLPTDEELFGMIPQCDGPHILGNAANVHHSLRDMYSLAFLPGKDIPKKLRPKPFLYAPGWDEWEEVNAKAKHHLRIALSNVYCKAFHHADSVIEDHLENTNGFIYSFPPSKLQLYKKCEDYKFDYFRFAPDSYAPPMEERLRKAYDQTHQDFETPLPWSIFWAVMASLAFALVITGSRIYTIFPQLAAWTAQSTLIYSIHIIFILGFLAIAGWLALIIRSDKDWAAHFLLHLVVIFLICYWGISYFKEPVVLDSDKWQDTFVHFLVKWPYLIFFGITWLLQMMAAIDNITSLRHYRKNYDRYRETYNKAYEEDFKKLYRYLRLRQLWRKFEGDSDPEWIENLAVRVGAYHEEYERLNEPPKEEPRKKQRRSR